MRVITSNLSIIRSQVGNYCQGSLPVHLLSNNTLLPLKPFVLPTGLESVYVTAYKLDKQWVRVKQVVHQKHCAHQRE